MNYKSEKYEFSEEEPQMVSDPVAVCPLPQQPVMHVIKKDVTYDQNQVDESFGLTKEQVAQIVDASNKAIAAGNVYSHTEVMNRAKNYEYGHSLV